ncbi:hypothetical protein THAOC_06814, partial [Thalassiosira oceanica]
RSLSSGRMTNRARDTARYQGGVNPTSMHTFMRALHGCSSLEEAATALPGWRASDVNDHVRAIPVYLALNKGGTMPDFLQLHDNDVINGHFSSEKAEIERKLALLPEHLTKDRVLSLYGIDLREAVKFVRASVAFSNIIPVAGTSTWVKKRLPEDYVAISRATNKVMPRVFGQFPNLFTNLDGVLVFGKQANAARGSLLSGLTGLLWSSPLCHPERHVRGVATAAERLSLFDAAAALCADLLGVDPISHLPGSEKFENVFIQARFTGSDAPRHNEAWDYFRHSTSGSHEERLAMVEAEFDRGHRDKVAARLGRTVSRTFEQSHLPRLLAIKQMDPDTKMVSKTNAMCKTQEYHTAYQYISDLRKRSKNGGLQSGEDEIVDRVEKLCIPIRNEAEVEEARKGAQSDMSRKRHEAESNAFARARSKKKGKRSK